MIEINSADDFTAVLANSTVVIADFAAAWCGPCRQLKPILEDLERESTVATFVKVDIDAQPDLAARYSVTSVPTVIALVAGVPAKVVTGAHPKAKLLRELGEWLG